MNIGDIFNTIFISPITNVLIVVYQLLNFLHVPYQLGFSIIILTILIRLILWPFVSQQIRSAHKMQKVAPHLNKIKELHKDDKKRQQEEMMKLYKEHGVNPMAGCLPLVIQLPIIFSLYNVLSTVVNENVKQAVAHINSILYFPGLKLNPTEWNTYFFGLPLYISPSKLMGSNIVLALAIPLITGALQFILSKMMLPHPDDVVKEQKKDDFQSTFQKQSLFIFPVMIAFFSFSLPLGLSLYWNTFTLFGIIQQYILVGPGGAHHWFEKAKIRKNGSRR